jgi:hypothetical protein
MREDAAEILAALLRSGRLQETAVVLLGSLGGGAKQFTDALP